MTHRCLVLFHARIVNRATMGTVVHRTRLQQYPIVVINNLRRCDPQRINLGPRRATPPFTLPRRHFVQQPHSTTPLQTKLPQFQERFQSLQNNNGKFPLLPELHQKAVDRKFAGVSDKEAAVLVLLLTVDNEISLLFTQRAAHLSQHAAQMSFPGGHKESHDDDLIQTALRETDEELDGPAFDCTILGLATTLPSIRGVPVTPVLAVADSLHLTSPVSDVWPGNRTEVDLVYTRSARSLAASERSEALPATRFNMYAEQAPVFDTPHGKIWGLTAYILHPVLHQLVLPVLQDT